MPARIASGYKVLPSVYTILNQTNQGQDAQQPTQSPVAPMQKLQAAADQPYGSGGYGTASNAAPDDTASETQKMFAAVDQPYGGPLPYGSAASSQQMYQPRTIDYVTAISGGGGGPMGFGNTAGGASDIDRFMGAIRQVESGGNYKIVNGIGASGAYQFMPGTWAGFGGYRRAADAPPAVQDAKARQMMSNYFNQFHDWRLVAIAWIGGPGLAAKVARNPSAASIGDGNIGAAAYASKVLGLMGPPGGGGFGRTAGGPVRFGSGPGWDGLQGGAKMKAALVLGAFPGLRFTSGYRDPRHNAEVGGVQGSDHLTGRATDMVGDNATMQRAAAFARSLGGRILIHNAGSGLHLHISW